MIGSQPVSAAGARYQESGAKLAQVRERIAQVQVLLRQEQAQQDAATAQLRALDEELGQLAARLHSIERKLADASVRVGALRGQVASRRARIGEHQEQLARQLRAAYANGRGGYLKLLLNEDDPSRLGRVLTYHRYVQTAHMHRIEAAAAEIRRLAELEQALAAEVAALQALREQALRAQQEIAAARQQRVAALEKVEARIAARGEQLDRLMADAAALERLLARLRDALADVEELQPEQRSFRDGRGVMDWPLAGALAARFGEARGVGGMRWRGVLIEGRPGDPVHAVARGHVVFADWLRGFGLLLIIDHGEGFMTLYGHNEAIFREAGDWVQPGEVIAAVGAGGVQRTPSLYFEVRSRGEPVDPLRWLRSPPRG